MLLNSNPVRHAGLQLGAETVGPGLTAAEVINPSGEIVRDWMHDPPNNYVALRTPTKGTYNRNIYGNPKGLRV